MNRQKSSPHYSANRAPTRAARSIQMNAAISVNVDDIYADIASMLFKEVTRAFTFANISSVACSAYLS